MSYEKPPDNNTVSWVAVILLLIFFWPLGLFFLFQKLTSTSAQRGRSSHPYDIRRQAAADEEHGRVRERRAAANRAAQHKKVSAGKGLIVAGVIMTCAIAPNLLIVLTNAVAGGNFRHALLPIFSNLGVFGAGLVLACAGIVRSRKAKRFRKYLACIGRRDRISVARLAAAMPVTSGRALYDLQEMLDKGYIAHGYLDYADKTLVLTDEGLPDDFPAGRQPEPPGMERENAVLREIREVNDSILNPELSLKIDRVGDITGRILAYLRKNPEKEKHLRSFLSYYLPTTLKILRAYAQMEAQGIGGENITAAKARIEGIMDKVVEGFEKQLDRLFQDEALDVASDVAVLEQMLGRDGLSSNGGGFQIGV